MTAAAAADAQTYLFGPGKSADKDWASATYALFARGGADESLLYMEIDGDPWSKSRPKFARRGKGVTTYQPEDDRAAEARLRERLRVRRREPFAGNVMLACRFYRANFQRIDTDNLLKHVCDSATGVLWVDDCQVTLVLGEVLYDADRPRTVIVAGNHASTLTRGRDRDRPCAYCWTVFTPPAGHHDRQCCSRACTLALRGITREPIACPVCETVFRPRTATQIVCSRPCANERRRGLPRSGSERRPCEVCGRLLTHYRGGKCRDCWCASPLAGTP